jgi:hypothetical protein
MVTKIHEVRIDDSQLEIAYILPIKFFDINSRLNRVYNKIKYKKRVTIIKNIYLYIFICKDNENVRANID